MALRTLQLCIVFTIGLSVNYSTLASSDSLPSGAAPGRPSLTAPPLTIRIRPPEHDEVIGVRGQSVVLRCPIDQVQRSGNVTFAWLHDGVPINFKNETRRQINEHNGVLTVTRVVGKKSASLEGQYRCVATNHIGTVVTEAISLNISTFARSFIAEPTNMTIMEGGNVIFPCHINSVPKPTVHWERNRSPIEYSHRYVQLQSGSLLIKNVQSTDAGSFQCSVTNRLQKKPRTSSTGNLIISLIKESSKITPTLPQFVPFNMSQIVNTKYGQNITLHCVANGWPKPLVYWKYKINENSTKYISNSSTLNFYNITAKETGIYVCSAENHLGTVTQEWVIQMAPYFNETSSTIEFPPPQTIRFNCSVNGYPTPNIRWLKDGKPLYMDRRITIKGKMLVLAATRRNDSGFYECIAENSAGESRSIVQVTIIQKEHHLVSPINLHCRPFSVSEVCLSWKSSVLSNPSIIGYTVHFYPTLNGSEIILVSKNEHMLIQNLKPNTSYTFYVRNYNIAVASEPSAFINCTGAQIGKREIQFNVESPHSMLVTWTHLINDTPCGGDRVYKIQWRRQNHHSNSAKVLHGNVHEFIIKDLIPNQKYEVRVLADPKFVDENVPWESFTMPNVNINNLVQNGTDSEGVHDPDNGLSNDTFYSRFINPPTQVDAVPVSKNVINVTWSPAKIDLEDDDVAFYMICYMDVNSMDNCDDGMNFVKSYTNEVKISGLKPFSQYVFKVRTHSVNEKYGRFSQLVECRTLEGVPSEVRDLDFNLNTVSKVMITWEQPDEINGVLKHYIIKYTKRSSLPIDQWSSVIIPPDQNSFSLPDFKIEDSYSVYVCAVNNAGSSQPVSLQIPNMSRPVIPGLHPPTTGSPEETPNQTFGILIGMLIAIICIICCILHLLWRRRCIKLFRGTDHRRSPGHRSGVQSTNGHSSNTTRSSEPVVTMHSLRYPTPRKSDAGSTCSVTLGEDGEAHEMQCLMMGNELISLPPHIPPAIGTHLDTKGGATYPNGHINGFKYPVMSNGRIANGIVRITENPQYESVTYDPNDNGHSNNNRMGDRVQNDSCIMDESKLSGFDMTVDSSTFDTTQLTSLDNSIGSASQRHKSPILDPNG